MLISNRTTNVLLVVLAVGIAVVAVLATACGADRSIRRAGLYRRRARAWHADLVAALLDTAGGYYYVTRALSAGAGQSGITICCSNTTIDLGGFTITGAGPGMNPGDGISNAGARNIVIQNGAVRSWTNGINLGGTYSRVERIHALSNTDDGIRIGAGSEVSDCVVSLNGGYGINANVVTIRNCTLSENFGLRDPGREHLRSRRTE